MSSTRNSLSNPKCPVEDVTSARLTSSTRGLSQQSKAYSEFTKQIITPNKLVHWGPQKSMNPVTYRMTAWLCVIAGNFLAFMGVVTNMWAANSISRAGLTDTSSFSAIFTYTSILVVGGIALIIIGMGLIWRARPHALPQKT